MSETIPLRFDFGRHQTIGRVFEGVDAAIRIADPGEMIVRIDAEGGFDRIRRDDCGGQTRFVSLDNILVSKAIDHGSKIAIIVVVELVEHNSRIQIDGSLMVSCAGHDVSQAVGIRRGDVSICQDRKEGRR